MALFLILEAPAIAERTARAEDEGAPGTLPGPSLALGIGYGLPYGQTSSGIGDLGQGLGGMLPLRLEAGYRFARRWYVGGYFQYGFVFGNSDPDAGPFGLPCSKDTTVENSGTVQGCSAHDMRFGIDVRVRMRPGEQINPWLGLGIGYELGGASLTTPGETITTTLGGVEWAHAQAGVDVRVLPALTVGPFVEAMFGEFLNASASSTHDGSGGLGIAPNGIRSGQHAFHGWLILGIRGQYDLPAW